MDGNDDESILNNSNASLRTSEGEVDCKSDNIVEFLVIIRTLMQIMNVLTLKIIMEVMILFLIFLIQDLVHLEEVHVSTCRLNKYS